jgi:serine/threonine protein kinase/Tol biopolymer transport system component
MAITAGTRLGPYEITSAIGAGGMGEVYRARDTRLNRTVAIKVLPEHFADRPELRERFEREAKTIASLNHPHICTLYDVGHQNGADYLVMEHIEGETLAQRLTKGALPLQQTLQYAIEIADALDKAHRKGITHRDLKPGNIMLTKAGTKLLDFGLAKLAQDAAPVTPESQTPTMKGAITAQGTILGTLQYMAPEQVEGKLDHIDARTDIFAFGVVVYEMATGKKAFEGKSQASLMAKILETDPPPISTLAPMTPPALDRVVKKCLTKDPDDRWQSARDICEQLRWIAGDENAPDRVPLSFPRKHWLTIVLETTVAVMALVIAALAVWALKPPASRPVTRFVIPLLPGQRLTTRTALAISPDGTRIVYAAGSGNLSSALYVRSMDGLEAQEIPGTEGDTADPFFSPDGQWLGFTKFGKLMKVALNGGAPINLDTAIGLNNATFYGATWGAQKTIAFVRSTSGPIEQVPDSGGDRVSPLTRLEKGEVTHRWPEFLPSGKSILFVATSLTGPAFSDQLKIAAQSVGGERRDLLSRGFRPRFSPSGHLIYVQGSNLMAVPFDPGMLKLLGPSVTVQEGIAVDLNSLSAQYSISSTGTLVYVPGSAVTRRLKLVWVDRKGAEQTVPAPTHNYVLPRISPDGQRVAAGIEEADSQVWLYDLGRDTLTRLTFEGGLNVDPIWTPDGKRIVFKGAANKLYWQPADGSAGGELLTSSELAGNNVPGSWTPDGQVLTFLEINPNTGYDVYTLKDGKPEPFVRTASLETAPRFSPDGRFIAYASDESGRVEVYVRPYPGPGGKWQISTEGGSEPVWNPKGRELFYRSGNKMMAVDIAMQPTFSAGKPKMLFEGPYVPTPRSFPDYDVSPDGQRFLMLKADAQAQAPTQINVVLNWFEELKQKAPAGTK